METTDIYFVMRNKNVRKTRRTKGPTNPLIVKNVMMIYREKKVMGYCIVERLRKVYHRIAWSDRATY